MVIRKARLSDVIQIVELWGDFMVEHTRIVVSKSPEKKKRREMIKEAKKSFSKWIARYIRSRNGLVSVAEAKHKIVGYSLSRINPNEKIYKLRYYGYIKNLYVLPKYRGKGISSLFKDMAVKWFKEKGMKYVAIAFYSENTLSHRIYKNWGFKDEYTEMWKKI